MRTTWTDLEPHRQLILTTKAVWLGLGSLADCHGAGGLVQCPAFAKVGEKGYPLLAPVLKEGAAARADLSSSFCCASTRRQLSGLSL